MDTISVGLLAHVDAGKTTLGEAMLYTAGALRRMGRVDHADTCLDTDAQERSRGITIFSKQARLTWRECSVTLVDTPGHVDFSTETERTLPVLDSAVLLISGTDGIQAHTRTLWRLLERYQVPVFLFVNKMDLAGAERQRRLEELRSVFGDGVADMDGDWMEQAAAESEEALESYLSRGTVPPEQVRELIRERKLFPCVFGAALRCEGVDALLTALTDYMPRLRPESGTAGRIYKISRDPLKNRLTWLRVTGETLRVRDTVTGTWDGEEKIAVRRLSRPEAAIRPVTGADRESWFSLDRHLSGEAFDRKVRDRMGYVLTLADRPAGILRWSLFWDSIPFCNMLYIREGERRKGLGRALMARWEQDMKALGYGLVMTSTQSDEEGQRFYRALGYVDCGSLTLPFRGYEQPTELFLAKAL